MLHMSHKHFLDVCDKHQKIYNCAEPYVCAKEHEIGHGSQQKFTKYCAQAEACTDDHCKKEGKRCTIDCCHQDLCNDINQPYNKSTIATSGTTLVFFILLVNIIYKFCLFWIRYLLNVISQLCNSLEETCSSCGWVLEGLNLKSGNPGSLDARQFLDLGKDV